MVNKTSKGKGREKGNNTDMVEVVANCDHLEEIDAKNDHIEMGEVALSQHDIEKLIITIRGEQVLIDQGVHLSILLISYP